MVIHSQKNTTSLEDLSECFPEGSAFRLEGHKFVDEIRQEIINTGRTTKGPVCIGKECRYEITEFLRSDHFALHILTVNQDLAPAAERLLERFEELVRRLKRNFTLELRHTCYKVLLSELVLNVHQYGHHRKDWSEFVAATLLNRRVVAAIPEELSAAGFELTRSSLVEAIVNHPRDPRRFLADIRAAEDRILADPEFCYFHEKRSFVRQACLYRSDPEEHLRSARKTIEQIQSTPEFDELPNWVIDAAVLYSHSKAKDSLRSLIQIRDEILADPKLGDMKGREWIIYQAFVEAPNRIRQHVTAWLARPNAQGVLGDSPKAVDQ